MFFQTTGARNDLMPELFQLPDLRCVDRACGSRSVRKCGFFGKSISQGVVNALIQCLVILR
jgi:hypothetical protein